MITKKTKETLNFLENISGKKLSFASLLTAIREGEEMSQAEFAKILGISRQYLCDLEHGRRFTSLKAAAKYAKKLGYAPQQFIRLALQDYADREGLKIIIEIKVA